MPRLPHSPFVALLMGACCAVGVGQERGEPEFRGDRYEYRPEGGEPDAVDARFPQNAERARQLRAIRRAVEAGDWDRAGNALLFLLGEAGGEVVRLSDGAAASVADEAELLLDEFPAEERRALRARLGGAADAALDRAGRDPAALRDVALAFPLTDAAVRAADRLAALHLERGEPLPAAHLIRRLFDVEGAPPAFTDDPRWRARAVAAYARAGRTETAQELWGFVTPEERVALDLPGGADEATGLPTALLAPPAAGAAESVGEPLPVVRWRAAVVADPAARAEFREAADSVRRAGGALLPAWRPLGAAGLALARTTEGAVAVDAATGAVRWRTEPDEDRRRASVYRYRRDRDAGLPGESNAVVAAMSRDAASGTLSSDGTRLFLLERGPDPGGRTYYYGRSDAAPVRLAAYRLADGRRDWEVGGEERGEIFDLPLAGWRVLGAPVADGGDLFCVAERVAAAGKKRIALFCLNPATGEPRWDVTVAYADAAIEEDVTRAKYGVRVAVAGGVVVAPSGVGWVAGVDRLTREAAVGAAGGGPAGRPAGPPRRVRVPRGPPESNGVEREPLGAFWTPGPPLVAGRTVVFAPPAEDRLYAFDLLTGEPPWRPRRRGPWQAVAGVIPAATLAAADGGEVEEEKAGAVVLVGGKAVAAVSLGRSGDRLWSVPCEPTGLPLIAGARVFVPAAGGRLLTVDAATGAVLRDAARGDDGEELGTLGSAGGRLVALGPGGLIGFEDDVDLAAALAAAEQGEEVSPELRLRAAERLRATGDPAAVLAELDRLGPPGDDWADDTARRFRALQTGALRAAALAAETPAARLAVLDRLAAAAYTDADRIAAARLRAFVLERDDPAAAVAVWRDLLAGRLGPDADAPDPLVPVNPDGGPPPAVAGFDAAPPDAEARLSRVASASLRALHEAGGPAAGAVDEFAAELLDAGADPLARPDSAAADVLPWHPSVRPARLRWCERALFDADFRGEPGDAGRAEIALRRLAAGPEGDASDAANDLLARLASVDPADDRAAIGPFDVVAEALAPAVPVPDGGAVLPGPAAGRPFFRSHALRGAGGGGRADVVRPGGAVVARLPLRGITGDPFRQIGADFGGPVRRAPNTPAAAAVGGPSSSSPAGPSPPRTPKPAPCCGPRTCPPPRARPSTAGPPSPARHAGRRGRRT